MPKSRSRKDYDEAAARKAGLTPDASGHWGSRDPVTGAVFKHPGHPTLVKSVEADRALGYRNVIQGTRMRSLPSGDPRLRTGAEGAPRDIDLSGATFPSELTRAVEKGLAPRSAQQRKRRAQKP